MSPALPSYSEAAILIAGRARILGSRPPAVESIDLGLAAGRVLAEPLRADRDHPPFHRSTRDGYACRAAEIATGSWLPVAGATRAGQPPAGPLPTNSAWEIMTGAPVPEGADAVVMLEHIEFDSARIRLLDSRTLHPGENIVPAGSEARQGAEVVPAGVRLDAAQIAFAAACGYAQVPVFARPRVAILTTGDEIVRVDSQPRPGQIRNSNAPMLAALVSAAGGKPVVLPNVADDAGALDEALAQAASADMLLVSGGVSAGKFDLVEDALARIGAAFHFTGARIQPGKPVVFGELPREQPSGQTQPFFGLPGNPISTAVTFLLFASPVLATLSGRSDLGPRFVMARLARECKGHPALTRFVPAVLTDGGPADPAPCVSPVPWQGSGDLAAFSRSNCFLVVQEGVDRLAAGDTVRILLP